MFITWEEFIMNFVKESSFQGSKGVLVLSNFTVSSRNWIDNFKCLFALVITIHKVTDKILFSVIKQNIHVTATKIATIPEPCYGN